MSDNKERIAMLSQRLNMLHVNMEKEKQGRSSAIVEDVHKLRQRFEKSTEANHNKFAALNEICDQVSQQIAL